MAFVCRLGDVSTGHSCYSSRPNDQGSPNFLVNGIPIHRVSDHWETHCCNVLPFDCHDGVCSSGSATYTVNGLAVGRIGDAISCGDTIKTGSPDFDVE